MAKVTIPRGIKDSNFRYMMPALIAKVEGKGHGNTSIVNMVEIAKDLERPASYPIKYFGIELGVSTIIEPEKGKFVVKGKHDQSRLALLLDEFIEQYVLCKKCNKNPETNIVLKGGVIELNCRACGGVNPVDMTHRLSTFILKNPPPKPKSIAPHLEHMHEGANLKAARKSKGSVQDGNDDDVEWFTDSSKEAAEQRKKNLLGNASQLFQHAEPQLDPLEILRVFLASNPTNEQVVALLRKVGENDEQIVRLAFLALFDVQSKQITASRLGVIKQVSNSSTQFAILEGMTEVAKDTAVLKAVPRILEHLYDEDVLEEEIILKWYSSKSSGDKVKEAAKVFADWLQTAEEST